MLWINWRKSSLSSLRWSICDSSAVFLLSRLPPCRSCRNVPPRGGGRRHASISTAAFARICRCEGQMYTLSPDQWQAVSPHLDEALGMAEEERSIWLSSLRSQNPTLADQLERLLGEHRALADKGFLEKHSVRLDGLGLAGQTLGVYTLLSQIGQGGMGSVWLGKRSDGRFERKVAIKFLNIALMGKGGE